MSDLFFTKTISGKNVSFINSENIAVFPCAYRGTGKYNPGGEGEAFQKISYDIESKINTEKSLLSLTTGKPRNSYVVEWTDDYLLTFILGGYTFRLMLLGDSLAHSFVGIKLADVKIVSSPKEQITKILQPLGGAAGEVLDVEDETSHSFYFAGLVFADSANGLPSDLTYTLELPTSKDALQSHKNRFISKYPEVQSKNPIYEITGDLVAGEHGKHSIVGLYGDDNTRNTAYGDNSFAIGYNTQAIAANAHSEGNATTASGEASHAEGYKTTAAGKGSHAEGYRMSENSSYNTAAADGSHVEGINTKVKNNASGAHAEGGNTIIGEYAEYAHAEGVNNTIEDGTSGTAAKSSHIEGAENVISSAGSKAHAEGYHTKAEAIGAHAEGGVDKATSEAQGYTIAAGSYSHAEGTKTYANNAAAHSEGDTTIASGKASHAEGVKTTAAGIGAHAEGYRDSDAKVDSEYNYNTAYAKASHVEGWNTIVTSTATAAHTEGRATIARGEYSHAEGNNTQANGNCAHAEGYYSKATGAETHAEGHNTTASGNYSHAEGYRASDATIDGYNYNTAAAIASHVEGQNTIVYYGATAAHAEGYNTSATKTAAHAEGYNTRATGIYSHTEGNNTSTGENANSAHAEGYNTTASGSYSHAEGASTTATNEGAHAEGKSAEATGEASHAEGLYTKASGNYAHAEGYGDSSTKTTALGIGSHAEGYKTTASGSYSHAEGNGTIANKPVQHVFGQYNISDTENNPLHFPNTSSGYGRYVEIVGNGTSTNRSNARTLDWYGNENLAGDIQVKTKIGFHNDKAASNNKAEIVYDATRQVIKFKFNN